MPPSILVVFCRGSRDETRGVTTNGQQMVAGPHQGMAPTRFVQVGKAFGLHWDEGDVAVLHFLRRLLARQQQQEQKYQKKTFFHATKIGFFFGWNRGF